MSPRGDSHSREGINLREEEEMDTFVREAGRILLGEKSEVELLASFVEMNKKIDDMESGILMELCKKSSWQVSAKIAQAVVVRTYGADHWPRLVLEVEEGAPYFWAGLLLGSFKAATWLDENCSIRTCFSDYFPRIICRFIICQNETAKNTGAVTSDKKYLSELSTAIKKWSGGGSQSWCGKGNRLADVGKIFISVQAVMEEVLFGKLSPLGEEILNQLCYAAFNSVSVEGRSIAMEYLLGGEHSGRLAERLAKKARGSTPMR